MKSLSICKQCKELITEEPFKFGKGLFCCPEHAAEFYETVKENPSKLRLSGITEQEIARIQGLLSQTDDICEDIPEDINPDRDDHQDLLSSNEDYLMPVYHLFCEITGGMTEDPDALKVLKEKTKDVDLIQLYYLLYDKHAGLVQIFNRAVCYNPKGAMAYMVGAALNMMKYYKPEYISPNRGVDDIKSNYYHSQDSDYKLVNNRIPLNSIFGNSNEEDDLI